MRTNLFKFLSASIVLSTVVGCSFKSEKNAESAVAESPNIPLVEVIPASADMKAESADAETPMPEYNLYNNKGQIIKLTSLKGKKVFVNFWATWCGPCRREMPSIESLYQKVKSDKVEFVMVALDDDFNKSINYVGQSKFTFPIYAPATPPPSLFNVQSIPTTFIFNEKGMLHKVIEGSVNYDTPEFINYFKGK